MTLQTLARRGCVLLWTTCCACLSQSSYANADLSGSRVTVSAPSAVVGGDAPLVVTVSARRASGAPVAGLAVAFDAGECTATPAKATTDGLGAASTAVASQRVTFCALKVTLGLNELSYTLPQRLSLSFTEGPAASLVLSAPQSAVAGQAFSVTVLAASASGAVSKDFRGTVSFSSDDPDARLPDAYAFTDADAGAHVFYGAALLRAGDLRLSASADGSTAPRPGVATVQVTGAAPTTFVFVNVPPVVQAGSVNTSVISLRDPYGNEASAFAGSIAIASDDPSEPAMPVLNFGSGATQAFAWHLDRSGARKLQATADFGTGSVVQSANVTVHPGPATQLRLQAPPTASATLPTSVVAAALDSLGNLDPNFTGAVALTASDLAATLPAPHAFQPSDAGAYSFTGLTLQATGPQRIDAAASGLAPATSTVQVYNVKHLASGPGAEHVCAILSDDSLRCWGSNDQGQLGLGDAQARGTQPSELGFNLPTVDLGTQRYAVSVRLGDQSSCAVLDDGNSKCWGGNSSAQLGLGDGANRGNAPQQMGDALPPLSFSGTPAVLEVASSRVNGFAITADGGMWGWGDNYECFHTGMDVGSACNNRLTPGRVSYVINDARAASLEAGYWSTVVLLEDGRVTGWGENWAGQIGVQSTDIVLFPTTAVDLGTGRTAVAVSAGLSSHCALLDTGDVKCWGFNDTGELGLGDTATRGDGNNMGDQLPVVALGIGRTARALSSGGNHRCAVLDTGGMKCWGLNASGQLGLGDTLSRGDSAPSMGDALPELVLGSGRTVLEVAASSESTCALLDNHLVKCWGKNSAGQLGLGDTLSRGGHSAEMGDALPYAIVW